MMFHNSMCSCLNKVMSVNMDASNLQSTIANELFRPQECLDKFNSAKTVVDAFSNFPTDIDYSESKAVMRVAFLLAFWSVQNGGGPFGTVIVNNGEVLSYGANHVVKHKDPTEHGEVNALRRALELSTKDKLQGATLFTSTYPCPMCCGLAIDFGIETIVYCNTDQDADKYGGFSDQQFWNEITQIDVAEEKSPDQYNIDGNTIVVTNEGQALDIVLRDYCQVHGFEPKNLAFDTCRSNVVVSLYEYTALRWAGVQVPSSVKIRAFNKPKFIQQSDFQEVGQHIFQLFKQMGDDYGQKTLS